MSVNLGTPAMPLSPRQRARARSTTTRLELEESWRNRPLPPLPPLDLQSDGVAEQVVHPAVSCGPSGDLNMRSRREWVHKHLSPTDHSSFWRTALFSRGQDIPMGAARSEPSSSCTTPSRHQRHPSSLSTLPTSHSRSMSDPFAPHPDQSTDRMGARHPQARGQSFLTRKGKERALEIVDASLADTNRQPFSLDNNSHASQTHPHDVPQHRSPSRQAQSFMSPHAATVHCLAAASRSSAAKSSRGQDIEDPRCRGASSSPLAFSTQPPCTPSTNSVRGHQQRRSRTDDSRSPIDLGVQLCFTSELVPPYLIPVLFAYDPEQKHHSNLWRRLRSNHSRPTQGGARRIDARRRKFGQLGAHHLLTDCDTSAAFTFPGRPSQKIS